MIKCILYLRRKRESRTFQIIKLRMLLTIIKPAEFKIELLHQLKGSMLLSRAIIFEEALTMNVTSRKAFLLLCGILIILLRATKHLSSSLSMLYLASDIRHLITWLTTICDFYIFLCYNERSSRSVLFAHAWLGIGRRFIASR